MSCPEAELVRLECDIARRAELRHAERLLWRPVSA